MGAAVDLVESAPAVIIETNKSTERLFPVVPDVEDPSFFKLMDELVEVNQKMIALQVCPAAKHRLWLPFVTSLLCNAKTG